MFVLAPLIERFCRDRSSHLFGTDGVHAARVFVEFETALFEGQAEMREQPPNFLFRIGDELFIKIRCTRPGKTASK